MNQQVYPGYHVQLPIHESDEPPSLIGSTSESDKGTGPLCGVPNCRKTHDVHATGYFLEYNSKVGNARPAGEMLGLTTHCTIDYRDCADMRAPNTKCHVLGAVRDVLVESQEDIPITRMVIHHVNGQQHMKDLMLEDREQVNLGILQMLTQSVKICTLRV